jgi:hypothetical protein
MMSSEDAANVARVFGLFPLFFSLVIALIAFVGGRYLALQFPAGVPPRWVATALALIVGLLLTYAGSVGVFKLAQFWAATITYPTGKEQIWGMEFRMGPWPMISFVINTLIFDASINHKRPKKLQRETKNEVVFADSLSLLMVASGEGNISQIRERLAAGDDVNARSAIGTTALMYAAKNGHLEVVRVLLAAGANAAVVSEKGSTAIHLAEKSKHASVVALLKSIHKGS